MKIETKGQLMTLCCTRTYKVPRYTVRYSLRYILCIDVVVKGQREGVTKIIRDPLGESLHGQVQSSLPPQINASDHLSCSF